MDDPSYEEGGLLQPGLTVAVNATEELEAVLTPEQWRQLAGEV
ncbi:MAG TPA: hypothetical protein VI172_14630 [Candidatus Dormibacteraeota bacterium]|jgi:hypothetical protein